MYSNIKIGERSKYYQKQLQLESTKSEFFSNMSHEFKTPLNIILSTIQLVDRILLEEGQGETGKEMERYSRIMNKIEKCSVEFSDIYCLN